MCGCPAPRWPLAGQDRHADAFSCAMPIRATLPAPAAAATSIYGRAISSFFSPLAKRRTGMPCAFANLSHLGRIYASPIFPNAADDGIGYPRCQRRNWHTIPTLCNRGTIGLQENPVHRAAGERHMIPQ